ncbi:dolichyl-diphosphooligosaccharide--protein glycosyltransferase subunit 1 [Rhodnius prolixus]|uniref:Dolichyl-diphosphooligosaccharide--protein glycosyltransferase subunit 1 n=1 Tax=Rhodnius prolixus TaxID=13249 RepID=R4FP91_RHOPR
MELRVLLLVVIGCISGCFGQDNQLADIIVKSVDRSIDISTQLTKVVCKIQMENVGKTAVNKFIFSIESPLNSRVSYLSAQATDAIKSSLKTSVTHIQGKESDSFWNIDLREQLLPGKLNTIEVEYILTDALTPYPTSITQKEKQYVKYVGNHYVYLPYNSQKQSTTVILGSRNIEHFSKLNPYSQSDSTITYGPFQQVPAYSNDPMTVHYENNSPFLKVLRIERVIEVSHWGNIAVEETIDLLHTGATLKGPFSRYDFQREAHSGLSSVKSFKTVLPAAATDAYYRDEIGNISTSHMRIMSDSVELDLRPRFPLFGGWKTHYVLGYNVPSYEYLYHAGDQYKLKMRVLDHVFDDMMVDELITKIILPEGSENIHLTLPFPMIRLPDSRHSTYLDTKGRPVISVTKQNLVENHIQQFELDYVFPRVLMLQEPLLVAFAFYILFLLVIIYVRLDFAISKDEAGESKLRISGIVDKILQHLDRRASTYSQMDEQFTKVKSTKDVNSFNSLYKTINQEYKAETSCIAELLLKLKTEAPEVSEKISELQRLDKTLKDIYLQKQSLYIDKLIPGKIGRGAFLDSEAALNKKKEETIDKINIIIKNLH